VSTHVELPISGMTCASCAARIEKRLNGLDGVEATVNYATEKASIAFAQDGATTTEDVIATIAQAGYEAVLPDTATSTAQLQHDPVDDLRRRLAFAALASLPLLALGMVPALQFDYWQWISLQLATPVLVWAAYPFHRAAWVNLRHGTATMDTLISIGTIAAWGCSTVVLIGGLDEDTYFEVAAVITTLILLGRYLEARAKSRSSEAIRLLLELGAKEARVIRDGEEVLVPLERSEERRVGKECRSRWSPYH